MMDDKKLVLLGSSSFELSEFVGKIYEDVQLPLTGGPLLNSMLLTKMSVVPIPQASKVGIDSVVLND